jgi:hypothetical protein
MQENVDGLKYICLKLDLAEWLDSLKADGNLSNAQDLIRTGIILALKLDEFVVQKKQDEVINRAEGDRNYNTGDIDLDGYITLLMKMFGGDGASHSKYRMQALANLGIEMIRDNFYDGVIQWDKIENEIKKKL